MEAKSFKNTVTVNLGDLEKKGDDTVDTEPIKIEITADSASKVYDGEELTKNTWKQTAGKLAEGNKVETVKVTGSQKLVGSSENVPSDAKIVDAAGQDVTKGYDITYKNGTLTVTDGTNPDDPKPVDDNLVVTKADSSNTAQYALGQKVTFDITATNIYADARTITLKEINGVTLEKSEFSNVAGGATVKTTATYTIAEKDILAGSFKNTVTAVIGKLTKTADATVKTAEATPHLTITKETTSQPANGTGYQLGETITYRITAKNDGNLTLTNAKVNDELTGDAWTIESLTPGESKEFTTEYTVTSDDILKGSVVNVATADADGPGGKKPDPTPGTKEDPTDPIDTSMTVVKTVTSEPAEGDEYALGETVEFEIVVTNTGNVPYNNIVVEDDLTGDSWTIATLAVGASQTFTTSHVVTADDAEAGSFTNIAVATADPIPDPKDPTNPKVPGTRGDVEVPTTDETIAGDVNYYSLIIRYFDEDGNQILKDRTYNETLKEGTEYYVKTPEYKGYTPDSPVVAGVLDGDTEVDVIFSRNSYKLTIRYVDMNGNTVAKRYLKEFFYGDKYSVKSPAIAGYEVSRGTVSGTMPARDVQVTVRYSTLPQPVKELETINDYATPLGLGNLVQTAGDCFE